MAEEIKTAMENSGGSGQRTQSKGFRWELLVLVLVLVVAACVIFVVMKVNYVNSPEYKLVTQGIWYMNGEPQIVFFEDGTGKYHGNVFYWKMIEDGRLRAVADGRSENYDIFFEDGEGKTGKIGTDVYLHLIDEDGDEQILEGGGIVKLQESGYDWSQWEHD